MQMDYEKILQHFDVRKRYPNKAQAICPCHDDRTASLTISKGNKCILLHCHAGCRFDDILDAAGLRKSDLFYDKPVSENVPQWLKFVQKCAERDGKKLVDYYHYSLLTGEYGFTRIRYKPKSFSYGILKDGRFTFRLNGQHREQIPAVYGSIESVKKAIKNGEPIFYCEGEKDTNTVIAQGFPAVTCGAVGDWRGDCTELFRNANVIMLAHNDSGGMELANKVKTDLQNIAKSVKIVAPCPDIEHGDITDYFNAGNTREDFEALIQETVTVKPAPVGQNLETAKKAGKPLELILKELKAETYETTDKGFGRLFADVFKKKHRYNPSRKDWMVFDGKRWIDDVEGLSARADAKQLSDALIKYAVLFDTEGKYLKSVTALCNLRNRNNMLTDARDVFPMKNEDLDKNDFYLNVLNGTLDLTGDNPKFSEHQPDMLLSKICNTEYKPEAKCERWERFISEVMQGDDDKIKFLQKLAGISLTGDTAEETCFILYGSTTRNGKSTFIETLLFLLNDYAISMRPETLAQKKNIDSRQASGDIARLAGCRLCNASEPPKRMIFDIALLKSLLGRDSITARHLHQREFSFIPKFKLTMNTNYLPQIADDTVFSSGRINVISFDRHFEPEEQDKALKKTLRRELPGILNWCLEGLKLYRQEGLQVPQAVKDATEAYREDSDKIGNFIKECLIKSDGNCTAGDAYEAYSKWCSECGAGTESKQHFFAELKSKGIFAAQGTVKGKTIRNVILKHELLDTDFEPVNDEELLPFE